MSYEVFAEFYDALTENVNYKDRANYISSLLNAYGIKGGLLLDLACGTGSLSLEMSKKGFSVIGTDISEEMLAEAQNKMYAENQNILFLQQDMRALDLYGTIDCAVCTLDSLNHLESIEDVKKAFQSVSLFLNPNGIFIFDMNTLYKHKEVLGNNAYIYDCEDVFCAWQNTLLEDNRTVQIDLDFFEEAKDGSYDRYSESFCECAYEQEEILSALKEAGLKLEAVYNEMTTDAPKDTAERLVFIARKETN